MALLSEEILDACRALGFAEAGIAPIRPTRWAEELTQWLGAGKHGEMEYLARNLEHRLDPSGLLPGACSMILVADQYGARNDVADRTLEAGRGRIARYARGRDYHEVIKKRLHDLCDSLRSRFPEAQFRAFTDTAPLLEREHAGRAGLGWVAKNTLLINPRLGSYLFLGGVLTTLDLVSAALHGGDDSGPADFAIGDHCGTCTRCIDACPTQAITPYSLNAGRCISYLTIEHRSVIEPEFHGPIGEWLYGCDVCQEVCPHNSPREPGLDVGSVNPAYEARRDSFDLLEVLRWTEAERREAFTSSAMKRASLAMMKRNALIVAGNLIERGKSLPDDALGEVEASDVQEMGRASATKHRAEARCHGDAAPQLITALLESVRHLAADESEPELVRRTARQVLDRLAARAGGPGAPPSGPAEATTPGAR